MLQNLVHLDIELEKDYHFEHRAGLQISSLNKNLKYLRLSGPVKLNTKGRDPCIENFDSKYLYQVCVVTG